MHLLPRKNIKSKFDSLQRLHGRNEYDGIGIGLAHCKEIVELHGWKIFVEPNAGKGKGSSFVFKIPFEPNFVTA